MKFLPSAGGGASHWGLLLPPQPDQRRSHRTGAGSGRGHCDHAQARGFRCAVTEGSTVARAPHRGGPVPDCARVNHSGFFGGCLSWVRRRLGHRRWRDSAFRPRQFEAECVLPVDAATRGRGRAAIREGLAQLQHGDERQPSGRPGRTAAGGERRRGLRVGEHGAKLIPQPQAGIARGNAARATAVWPGTSAGELG